jgi:valyl-tRNA synthetase
VRANAAVTQLTGALEDFDFHGYALKLYDFVWSEFCDWYVESAKAAFHGAAGARRDLTRRVFDYVFARLLKLLHPVMPFVTEELYHQLGYVAEGDSIMRAAWPAMDRYGTADPEADLVAEKFALIRSGRDLRRHYNIPTARKVPYFVKPSAPAFARLLAADPDSVRVLLNAETVKIDAAYEPAGVVPSAAGTFGRIFLPLAGIVDVAAERQRLTKQQTELEQYLAGLDRKLGNAKFLSKAPADVVRSEQARRAELAAKLDEVRHVLADLPPA